MLWQRTPPNPRHQEEPKGAAFVGLDLRNEMSCHFSQSLHSRRIPGWGSLVKADVPVHPLKQTEHTGAQRVTPGGQYRKVTENGALVTEGANMQSQKTSKAKDEKMKENIAFGFPKKVEKKTKKGKWTFSKIITCIYPDNKGRYNNRNP